MNKDQIDSRLGRKFFRKLWTLFGLEDLYVKNCKHKNGLQESHRLSFAFFQKMKLFVKKSVPRHAWVSYVILKIFFCCDSSKTVIKKKQLLLYLFTLWF